MPTMPKTFTKEGRFEKNPNDFYETPLALCERVWWRIVESFGAPSDPMRVLDPGMGSGRWGAGLRNVLRKRYPQIDAAITGIDIRPDALSAEYASSYDKTYEGDYLRFPLGEKFDYVVGNPPYSAPTNKRLALDFALRSMDAAKPNGLIALLYKLDFMAGTERYLELFHDNPPNEVWVLGRVPWLANSRSTNTIDYAMFVWDFERGTAGNHAPEIDWMLNWRNGC